MKKGLQLLGCLVQLLFSISLFAQQPQVTIKGFIKDEDRHPVEGATVKEKGTTNSTLTKTDGSFSIKVNNPSGFTLTVTSVSHATEEYTATQRPAGAIAITLRAKNDQLDDVVVIAYGSSSKKLVSNSIVSIAGKDIEEQPVASPAEAMVGMVAGADIATPSGEPGTNPYIRIRGQGSVGAGNDPLYVIDGYPIDGSSSFYNINPADIQSIQVLKDAASCAVYGSRGGNGIVLVTTKKGNAGKAKFSFNAYTGMQTLSKKVEVLNPGQFADYIKEAYKNSGATAPAVYNNPSAWTTTDWQDEIFKTGTQQNAHLSASGGTDAARYYVSGSYFKQDGIVKGSGYDRISVRANLNARLSKKLRLGLLFSPNFTRTDVKPISGSFNVASISGGGPANLGASVTSALLLPPNIPVMAANGDYTQRENANGAITVNGLYNPVAALDLYQDRVKNLRVTGLGFLEIDVLRNLLFKTTIGSEVSSDRRNWYVPATLATGNAATANLSNPVLANIDARQISNDSYNWIFENTLSYANTFAGKHRFSALAGYSAQRNSKEGSAVYGQAGSYTNANVEYVTGAGLVFGSATNTSNSLASVFGRLDYNYNQKYILSAAIRTDGSSRFGTDVMYATFPSVSAAWRISEESFLRSYKWLSELKLRVSYGVTGNNNIGDYAWQAYQVPANYSLGSGNGNVVYGFVPNSVAVKDLSWETNKQTDLGLEAGILNNRLYFSVDYYKRNTTNLLLNRNVPAVIGVTNRVLNNVGEVENYGLDVAIESKNINGKIFKWSTAANVFFNRNKVLALAGEDDQILFTPVVGYTSSARVVAGLPMGSFFGYKKLGVYMSADDLAKSPKWTGAQPGDLKFEDVTGDGKVDADDITYLGNPYPKFSLGITNRFSYKNVSLNVTIQGSFGAKIMNGGDRYTYNFYGKVNARTNVLNRWHSEADPGDGQTPRVTSTLPTSLSVFSTHQLFSASYLRVRNIQLRYSLPGAVSKLLGLETAAVYASAVNPFTFTNYFGYNPEANLYGNSVNPTYGVDLGSYPTSRTFTFGVNITFK